MNRGGERERERRYGETERESEGERACSDLGDIDTL